MLILGYMQTRNELTFFILNCIHIVSFVRMGPPNFALLTPNFGLPLSLSQLRQFPWFILCCYFGNLADMLGCGAATPPYDV